MERRYANLIEAVRNDVSVDELQQYLVGKNVDRKDEWGLTALCYASSYGNLSLAQALIDAGARIDNKDGYFNVSCPLHYAAQGGNLECVKLLVERGAYVNEQDVDGDSPAHVAARFGHFHIIEYLVHNGANPYLVNNKGEDVLDLMKLYPSSEIRRKIVQIWESHKMQNSNMKF